MHCKLKSTFCLLFDRIPLHCLFLLYLIIFSYRLTFDKSLFSTECTIGMVEGDLK